jgi:pimeloyl-ACP methyl ester carboxylesterase
MESKNNFVISNDGARIHYCTVGSGPSLIVIPGIMSLVADYKVLADALAGTFTIHTIERRGRGLSDPQAEDYSIVKEREDVIVLQKKTDAAFFFGHSFGGLVALEAARNNFDLKKLAVFEPGISSNGSISVAWSSRYKQQLEQQRYVDAFAGFSFDRLDHFGPVKSGMRAIAQALIEYFTY